MCYWLNALLPATAIIIVTSFIVFLNKLLDSAFCYRYIRFDRSISVSTDINQFHLMLFREQFILHISEIGIPKFENRNF